MCNATHSKLRCWRKGVVPTAERKFQHYWKTDEKAKSEKKRILVDDFARYPKTRKWVTIPALGYEAEQPQKSVLDLSDKFLVA